MSVLLNQINAQQRRAADPQASVFVSASAGSGKTKVLTDRVLRLLLNQTPPERLLCLTFTKTAATEMANRITKMLRIWAVIPQDKLIQELTGLIGKEPTLTEIKTARQLFSKTLETPGGLKIMTIHSFCQSVLKRFPLEAGVSPNFDIMDETTADVLLRQASEHILGETDLKNDIKILSAFVTQEGLNTLLTCALQDIQDIPLDIWEKDISKYFNIDKYSDEKQIISEVCDSEEEFHELCARCLTKSGTIRRHLKESDALIADTVYTATERLKVFSLKKATKALIRLTKAIRAQYDTLKRRESLLDYNDLIEKTRVLLQQNAMAAWVLFKLDGGIDHILVDEAQDTNTAQWSVVKTLAEEFFSGIGAKNIDSPRTIFAVGDKKQSIYSFQGADPSEFERIRHLFEQRVTHAQQHFENVPLNASFRSTHAVLALVNRVLTSPEASRGILNSDETAVHVSTRSKQAGLVEIWPLEEASKSDTPESWKPPVERQQDPSAVTRLAQKITHKIKTMLTRGEFLDSENRPVQAGDFLILVQRRRQLTNELVRLLKEANIPVAGIDRLILSDHIAVQDLIALMRFILLPEDDLTLACLLKSPIIGFDEETLMALSLDRGNNSLWQTLIERYPETAGRLKKIQALNTFTPFEFLTHVLGPMNARRAFEERLGPEVHEALDELLTLALNFEQTAAPSIQGFIYWIGERDIEIKRDLENTSNAVRIMTVHASKGLQGKIVFLPDTTFVPDKMPDFVATPKGSQLWIARSSLKTEQIEELADQSIHLGHEEYHRLMYVALTRAADRLYICGYKTKNQVKGHCWYQLIQNSLIEILPSYPDVANILIPSENKEDTVYIEHTSEGIIRLFNGTFSSTISDAVQKTTQKTTSDVPLWAITPAPFEPTLSHPLMPSRPDRENDEECFLSESQAYALRRGTFLHKLLQYLPELPENERRKASEKICPPDIEIPDQLFELMTDPRFKSLFSPDSMAEVPLVGILDGKIISAQVDRLVILNNTVILIDYKTNRHVPKTPDQIPENYKNQIKTYKRLLKKIFPDKLVKAYLLWLETLTVTEVEE